MKIYRLLGMHDRECNILRGAGGLQLSINGTGFENYSFTVRLGETLLANGSVRAHMTAGCHYEEVWTLATGVNVFDMGQEYKEWRWAELVGLPTQIDVVDASSFAFSACSKSA